MIDPWALLAVAVPFVSGLAGGFVVGIAVAVKVINAPIVDYNRKLRAVRVVVVAEGRRIQMIARAHRLVLAPFGLAGIADHMAEIGARLVECDDPNNPVPETKP